MSLQEQKAQLFTMLQKALELELSTLPPYLTALLSIKREANRVAANLIRGVMMEEMLHMLLVGNLVSSLGGKVAIGPTTIPSYPLRMEFQGKVFKDREFDVNLGRFSADAIEIFKQIELPSSFVERAGVLAAQPEIVIPAITIGAFYQQVIALLDVMCAEYGEAAVFCGDPSVQVGEQYYWGGGGKPIIIRDLASAKQALELIITQGEGADDSIFDDDQAYFAQPEEVAHYFRFNEIACGRYYGPDDNPREPPTGDCFAVDYSAVFLIQSNSKQTDYAVGSRLATLNENFNLQYSLMLAQIEQALNGQPSILYDAITNGMHSLTSTALEMMALPIDGLEGVNGAPSFEWVELP